MTRENKLALVVGFGLILFVGILISDHFSVARNQEAANITKVLDPLVATNVEPVSLVDLIEKPAPPPAPPVQLQEVPNNTQANTTQNPTDAGSAQNSGVTPAGPTQIVQGQIIADPPMDILSNPPAGFEKVANPENDAFVFHEVTEGETLYSICRDQVGNVSSLQALADFNNLDDPGSLRIGQKIRIPRDMNTASGTDVQRSEKPATESSKPAVKPASKPKATVTYTVRKGDTLRIIAERMTGNKKNWQKIYNMNKDVVDDPDNVKVGTVLRIS